MKEKAFFVKRPRTAADLMQPHLLSQEREYRVVRTLVLGKTDYENFITDMLADRQFLEDNAALCARDAVWRCLLIRPQRCGDGVLVMPERGCFVGWAARYAE